VERTLCAGLQIATSSEKIFSPGGISCYLVPGFTPSTAQFVPNEIISKEVCRVCSTAMSVHLPSYMSCLVSSSSPVMVQLYSLYSHTSYIHTVIQVTFIHSYIYTFVQFYIHTFLLSLIHTFMHTQHIHNIDSHVIALVI